MKNLKKLIYLLIIFLSTNIYSQTNQKTNAETYYKSAVSLFQTGDLDNAIININKSISIEPNNSNAHYTKGVIYQKQLNYKVALSCYKKSIQINPQNTEAMLKCAIVYGKMNDMVNCCKYLNMACENGNNDGCTGFSRFCK
ncbi:tetratricopeptide repeat protein [Flavobacterium sp. ZB4P13]|uniref:tetratricopeptide repeat protein n=1 Tax=Flavobacterium sp. ZB4P13 TaxID=3401728 RepID=UPI003AAE0495